MNSLIKKLSQKRQSQKSLLAFNIQDIIQLEALSDVCLDRNIECICQFSERYFLFYEKIYNLKKIINFYRKRKIFFFLDHCSSLQTIKLALKYNFDGIMFDGSKFNLSKNIKLTNKVYNLTKKKGALLEAEIGPVINENETINKNHQLTDEDVIKFIEKANFDLLALGAGNTHGLKKNVKVNLNLFKLAKNKKNKINLVFHGGSGTKKKVLIESQKQNVIKINFSSNLKAEMKKNYSLFLKKNKYFDRLSFNSFLKKKLKFFYSKQLKIYT